MARCQGNNLDIQIGGYRVYSQNGEIRCTCNYYLKNGRCIHSAEGKRYICSWRGEPNMTIVNNKPTKVCPRCGSPTI